MGFDPQPFGLKLSVQCRHRASVRVRGSGVPASSPVMASIPDALREVAVRILESTLNTFGHADVEPTPLSAQRELQRFLEEGQAGRIKLIVQYWFKRPRMGYTIRDLCSKMETKKRTSDQKHLYYLRHRADQAALADIFDESAALADHVAAIEGPQMPLAIEDGPVVDDDG